jgi:cell division protein FtsB
MIEVLAVYFGIGLVISVIAIREDKVAKGFNPNAKDGDNDGLVQENTKWERKAKK